MKPKRKSTFYQLITLIVCLWTMNVNGTDDSEDATTTTTVPTESTSPRLGSSISGMGCPTLEVTGLWQSPIDLSDFLVQPDCNELSFYGYDQNKKTLVVRNSGQTVRLEGDGKSFVVGGPLENVFKFSNLHFHWGNDSNHGSEHTLRGRRFPLELHLVHYNSKYSSIYEAMTHQDGLAVIGVFVDAVDDATEDFSGVAEHLMGVIKTTDEVVLPSSSLSFLRPIMESSEYFTYDGSLTTKPFCENVKWIIFQRTASVWSEHIKSFQRLQSTDDAPIQSNMRSLQDRYNRTITFCSATKESAIQFPRAVETLSKPSEVPEVDENLAPNSGVEDSSTETGFGTAFDREYPTLVETTEQDPDAPVFLGIFPPPPFLEIPLPSSHHTHADSEKLSRPRAESRPPHSSHHISLWNKSVSHGNLPHDSFFKNLDF